MFDELWSSLLNNKSTSLPGILPQVSQRSASLLLEYKKKFFNGTALSVFGCNPSLAGYQLSEAKTELSIAGVPTYNTHVIQYLRVLEERNHCSGLCKASNFYSFSDIQQGPPKDSCLNYVIKDFTQMSGPYRKFAACLITSGLVVLMGWFFSFGVCFRLRWEHRGSPLALGYVIKRVTTDEDLDRIV